MISNNGSVQTAGNGRLNVNVYMGAVGTPAENAIVKITSSDDPSGEMEQLVTNSSGRTEVITLPTPPTEFSMDPEQEQPFRRYNIDVLLDGFKETIINGVQLFPDTTAIQEVRLEPITTSGIQQQEITIPPPVLWGDFPGKIPEAPVKPLPPPLNYIVLPNPVVPEFIIVHDGAPSDASAANYWVPFKDYIKNVASCEVYSNWPTETIRANILAILSFTLNRVYTEWYRSRGYEFTITSSTAYDHAFSYGRNIFQEISFIVDEIFTTFITKPDIKQPLLTQYCDGQNVTCPGWMTQWGSKSLGDQGYNAVDILKSYYGSEIYLMQAERVEGVPSSFPGEPLQMGSTGQSVRTIQEQLNAISNNYPAIGKLAVDGIYGNGTRLSVETFQDIFNLPSSGIVDFGTWYRISQIFVAVTQIA